MALSKNQAEDHDSCRILAGLIPIMFSHGTGSDVMKRIAAPMVGGVVTSTILELIIYPVIYILWKGREVKKVEAGRAYGIEIIDILPA